MTSLSASSPGAPPDGASAAPAAPDTPSGRALPLTMGRRFALAFGVPAAVLLIAITGFSLVGDLGKASYQVSRTFAVPQGKLTLAVSGGDVTVTDGARPGLAGLTGTVHYSLVRPTLYVDPRDSRADGAASIHLGCPFAAITDCTFDGRVVVPATTALTVSTGGGNMTVRGLSAPVSVFTGGGDIHATGLTGPVSLSTAGGNLTTSQLYGRTLSLHTGGGDITGTMVNSPEVTASSAGGNVRLTFTSVPRNVTISTGGGDVTVIVPPGGGYHVTTHTGGGNISNSLGDDKSATNDISVSTAGGNITIESA